MNARSTIGLHTGRSMPVMGLGTWQLTHNTAGTISEALRLGYRMIDTSGDYGTQPGIGDGIRRSQIMRNDLYIVTKIEEDDDPLAATRANLKQLGLDRVNLMLIHRPPPSGSGENLWQGLIEARDLGLTDDIGVSNYSEDQIERLIESTGEVPVVNQIEWSPFGHSEDMLEYCTDNDIVIQAYSPITRTDRLDDSDLNRIADSYDRSPAQIMIRWCLQLGVVPLPKANSIEHLEENIDVFDFDINDEDMEALMSMNQEYSALGSLAYV